MALFLLMYQLDRKYFGNVTFCFYLCTWVPNRGTHQHPVKNTKNTRYSQVNNSSNKLLHTNLCASCDARLCLLKLRVSFRLPTYSAIERVQTTHKTPRSIVIIARNYFSLKTFSVRREFVRKGCVRQLASPYTEKSHILQYPSPSLSFFHNGIVEQEIETTILGENALVLITFST